MYNALVQTLSGLYVRRSISMSTILLSVMNKVPFCKALHFGSLSRKPSQVVKHFHVIIRTLCKMDFATSALSHIHEPLALLACGKAFLPSR